MRVVGWTAAALLLLLVILYVFRSALLGRVIADKVASLLSEEIGGRFEVASVEGNLFTEIDLVGIRAVGAPDPAVERLEIARVSIRYPFLAILRGDAMSSVTAVEATGLALEIDTTKERPPVAKPFDVRTLPTRLPGISVTGSVSVRSNVGAFGVGRFELSGSGSTLRLVLDPLALPAGWNQAPSRIEGVIERPSVDELTWSSESGVAGVALRSIRVSSQSAPAAYEIGLADGRIAGTLDRDTIAFTIEGLALEQLPKWIRDMVEDQDVIPARGSLSATGSLAAWTAPERALRAELQAKDVSWAGIPIETLSATGVWSGRRIDVATVHGVVARAKIEGEGVGLLLKDPLVVVAVGDVRADGPDASQFAAAFRLIDDAASWPAGWTVSLRARRAEGQAISVERLAVENAELAVETSGTVAPGPRWRDWRAFPISLKVTGRSKTAQERVLADGTKVAAGELTATADARGALGAPAATFSVSGSRVRIAAEPIESATATGSVAWPVVSFDRLTATTAEGSLAAAGRLDVEAREVRDATFEVELKKLAVLQRLFPDLPAVTGSAHAKGTVRRANASSAELSATVTGRNVFVGRLELGAVEVSGALEGKAARLDRVWVSGHYAEAEAAGTVTLGSLTDAAAELDVTARAPELSRLSVFWDGFGHAKGTGRFKGHVTKPAGASIERASWSGALRADDFEVGAWQVGGASANARIEWPKLTVTALHAAGPHGKVTGDASIDMATGDVESATLDVDLETELNAIDLGPTVPSLRGLVAAKGRIEKREGRGWRSLRGDVEIDSDAVTVAGRTIRDFRAHVTSSGEAIRVEEVGGSVEGIDVEARGTVVPRERGVSVEIDALTSTLPKGGSVVLARPATVRWDEGALAVGPFELTGLGGRLSGSGSFGDRIDVKLEARALELAAVLPDATGRVDFDLQASGAPADLSLSARVHAPELTFRGQKVSIETSLELADHVLVVESVCVEAGNVLELHGKGRFGVVSFHAWKPVLAPLDDADFALRGKSAGSTAWRQLGIRAPTRLSDVTFDATARGRDLSLQARATLLVRRGRDDQAAVDVPVELDVRLSPAGAKVDLRAIEGDTPLATVRLESDRSFGWTELGRAIGGESPHIDGRIDVEVTDAAPLAPFFPELRHLGGKLRIDADVEGTFAEPSLRGAASLKEFSVRFEADAPGLDDVVAELRLDGRQVHIDKLEGRTGYSPFSVSGGATFESLRRPVLDVGVKGTNLLIARDDDLRLRADLDTSVKGPLDALRVAGKARITDTLWSQPMDLAGGRPGGTSAVSGKSEQIFQLRNPPLSTATFDLQVTGDKTIRVDNNLVHAVLSADLSLKGSGEAPRLEGTIATQRAYVRLPFTRLDVERAEIQFRPADQYRPRLDAVAWTRIKGYELTVHVRGVLPDVDVKVASLPHMSQRDAYLLLTTGITPTELASQGITRAALNRAGSVYGTELLSQFSNAKDQNALERFSVEIGRDQSDDGQPTIDVEAPLSEKFFLHGQRDRFDDYNAGIIWRVRFR